MSELNHLPYSDLLRAAHRLFGDPIFRATGGTLCPPVLAANQHSGEDIGAVMLSQTTQDQTAEIEIWTSTYDMNLSLGSGNRSVITLSIDSAERQVEVAFGDDGTVATKCEAGGRWLHIWSRGLDLKELSIERISGES